MSLLCSFKAMHIGIIGFIHSITVQNTMNEIDKSTDALAAEEESHYDPLPQATSTFNRTYSGRTSSLRKTY